MNDESIRIYVYTATDGYSWQGCGETLAASLRKCMDATGETASFETDRKPLGGFLRWAVGGEFGTVAWRLHVRRRGDFRGRDSLYVALAFFPFRLAVGRRFDYAALWRHPLFAAPSPDPVDSLSVPLAELGELDDGVAGIGSFWDSPVSDRMIAGEEREVLQEIAGMFQDGRTELGSLSAVLRRGGGGDGITAKVSYKPFAEVEAVRAAREACLAAVQAGNDRDVIRSRLVDWSDAADRLKALAGKMPAFQGLGAFRDCQKKEEREILDQLSRPAPPAAPAAEEVVSETEGTPASGPADGGGSAPDLSLQGEEHVRPATASSPVPVSGGPVAGPRPGKPKSGGVRKWITVSAGGVRKKPADPPGGAGTSGCPAGAGNQAKARQSIFALYSSPRTRPGCPVFLVLLLVALSFFAGWQLRGCRIRSVSPAEKEVVSEGPVEKGDSSGEAGSVAEERPKAENGPVETVKKEEQESTGTENNPVSESAVEAAAGGRPAPDPQPDDVRQGRAGESDQGAAAPPAGGKSAADVSGGLDGGPGAGADSSRDRRRRAGP